MSKSAPRPLPPHTHTHRHTNHSCPEMPVVVFCLFFNWKEKKIQKKKKKFFKASRPGWWVILWDLADLFWGRKKSCNQFSSIITNTTSAFHFLFSPIYFIFCWCSLHEVEHLREKKKEKKIYYIITISQLTKKRVLLLSFFFSAMHIIIMQTQPISRGFVCCLALEKVQHC